MEPEGGVGVRLGRVRVGEQARQRAAQAKARGTEGCWCFEEPERAWIPC